jgi:hypothetical protein
LFPLLLVPLAVLARTLARRQRLRLAVVGCAVGAAMVLPWVTFNLVRFENPVLLSTGIGNTLAAGSCDATYYGRLIGYYDVCYTGPYPEGVDESEHDRAPREYALDYIDAHTSRIPVVVAARVGRLWDVFKPGQTTMLDWWIEGRGRAPSWMSLGVFYALVPFAVAGLVLMRKRKIAILPVVAPMVIATLAAATTFGITRYRAPSEIGLVLAAAIGVVAAWSWLRTRWSSAWVRA